MGGPERPGAGAGGPVPVGLPRTAGFNTVDLTLLSAPTLLVTILLMLVERLPGSTAGGFKTTTLAVLFLAVLGVFRRQSGASAFGSGCRRWSSATPAPCSCST